MRTVEILEDRMPKAVRDAIHERAVSSVNLEDGSWGDELGCTEFPPKAYGFRPDGYPYRAKIKRTEIGPFPEGQQVVQSWVLMDEVVYTPDRSEVQRSVSAFSIWVGGPYAGDICVYCGTNNGPNGELRNSYDCGACGQN